MRRFSQRNTLVTLSDINITPLLDLAFVLLIIFMITTPLLVREHSMNIRLPDGGGASARVERKDLRTVEISRDGRYMLDRREIALDDIERLLVATFATNRQMVVNIRADEEAMTKHLYPVIDRCTRNGITRLSLRTEAAGRP
ncbi:MAG TPA: biopolymer transporter ExbD [Verrucomicrobiota bacterium]|nr:biopolymer transporter ExbD [Verrucomicrobiota bacterium]